MKEIADKWLEKMISFYEARCQKNDEAIIAAEEQLRRKQIELEEERASVLSKIKV